MATLASVCAAQGATREVAVLVVATGQLVAYDWNSWNGGITYHRLMLEVPPEVYAQTVATRDTLERSLAERLEQMGGQFPGEIINAVAITPAFVANNDWRQQAVAWLRGEGITNQGRVRSDNIATRSCDGLLFRSQPEIHLYQALKGRGVSFAPLPVFVRGGQSYRRIEPDFVIVHRGVTMAVEVDGDTVHRETPAEAHDRTTMLAHEGVQVERVKASDCETPEFAARCAARLMTLLERYKDLRA